MTTPQPATPGSDSVREEWRPVVGYEGLYEVSDQGRVRSLTGRLLKSYSGAGTYRYVHLRRDGDGRGYRIHRLVLSAFVRPPMSEEVSRHLNGDRIDNRLSNLAWGTQAENVADMIAHGRHANMNRTHCSRGHLYAEPEYAGRERRCATCRRENNLQTTTCEHCGRQITSYNMARHVRRHHLAEVAA